MSNELFNTHIKLGEPYGNDVGIMELADWAGYYIMEQKAELDKRETYWRNWNGRAANHAAKLEAEIERLKKLADSQAELILELERGGHKPERDEWKRRAVYVWDKYGDKRDREEEVAEWFKEDE